MKKDLKAEILSTAKDLFNTRGYNEVSMRNIADALEISVGNLTYHFKKKEDLVEAVILAQHTHYKKKPEPKTLEELNLFFQRILKHQSKNAYYFRHYTQLAQISPKVYEVQLGVMKDWCVTLKGGFSNLYEAGFMKPEFFEGQWDNLIGVLRLTCIHGPEYFDGDRLAILWGLIYPQLTEKGKTRFNETIGLIHVLDDVKV